ncbi:hypothetical protein G6F52_007093 [Rhizopus delemar]|nr:hypothetical protein G6F52_007093 [Rhizopus delemar]
MPNTIPKLQLIRRMTYMICISFYYSIRVTLSLFVWLGLVPYVTFWWWRFSAWSSVGTQRILSRILFRPLVDIPKQAKYQWNLETILYDCMKGWIIGFSFALLSIIALLLHEWLEQNVPFIDDIQQQQQRMPEVANEGIDDDDVIHFMNNNNNVNEEEIVAGVDDVNGLLQGIGIKGNILNLFQNASLITLLLCMSLEIGIWVPYMIGTSFIMFQPWKLLEYSIQVLRSLLDPALDYLLDQITQHIPLSIRSALYSAFIHLHQSTQTSSSSASVSTNALSNAWHIVYRYFLDMPSSDNYIKITGCILTGYATVAFIGIIYLSQTHHYSRIGRTARQAIYQSCLCMKVTLFIITELIIFPIGCGYLIDLSALPPLFFRSAQEGLDQLKNYFMCAPVASLFLHWVTGTVFMFLFTTTVSFFRGVFRPGVIWFIRDPNDPQFHAMKELIERSIWSQFKKLCLVATVYISVILAGIGFFARLAALLMNGYLLPLTWNYSEPLFTVPFDLLAILYIAPCIVSYVNHGEKLERLLTAWTKQLLHQFRLTSFFLGSRPLDEEGDIFYKTWTSRLRRPRYNPQENQQDVLRFERTGQLLVVPKHDRVHSYLPGRSMLVPADPVSQEPIGGHPAARNREELEANTTLVYAPPHFKIRVFSMLLTLWVSIHLFVLFVLILLPISIGRKLISRPVHDAYSHFLGCLFLSLIEAVRMTMGSISFRNLSKWVFNLIATLILFGLVIPLLFGLTLELYINIPTQDSQVLVIQPIFVWANGLVCLALFQIICQRVLPATHPLNISMTRLSSQGISNFNLNQELKEVIIPFTSIILLMILFPYAIVEANRHYFKLSDKDPIDLIRSVYPCVSAVFFIYYALCLAVGYMKQWMETVREDTYLVGRILHNFEDIP